MALLLLAGCSGDASTDDAARDESPTTAPSTRDEPTGGPEPRGEAAAETGLRGIGATHAEWATSREQAPGFAEGAAFGPLLADGQPTYAAVSGDDHVFSFSRNFPRGMTLEQARQLLRVEDLPPDVQLAEEVTLDECYISQWTSAQLNAAHPDTVISLSLHSEDVLLEQDAITFGNVSLLPGDSRVGDFFC